MEIKSSRRFISLATRDTLAIILAGGRGTRLGELTRRRAKPAIPFGGKFRIIDFALSNCINSGIRRVGVATQYMAHPLIRHLQQGWGFLRGEFNEFIEIMPAQQRISDSWYRGTADAVYQNSDIIATHQPRFLLILGGDHVYKMDYGAMLGYHLSHDAQVTVGCMDVPLEEASEFGVMTVDEEGRISAFQEKPAHPTPMPGEPGRAMVSMGIYLFNTDYLMEMLNQDAVNESSSHDFGKDILPRAVREQHGVYAYLFRDPKTGKRAYWRDVGTIDSYWASNLELIGVVPELDLYDKSWPIWTYQEQLPPAKFVFNDEDCRGMAVDSMVAGGCIVSGACVIHSLLFSDVIVEKHSVVEHSVILPDVDVGPHCRIRNAVIDSGCRIPPGTVIGHDQQADRQRFSVSPKGIVVVTPEMLSQENVYVR